MNNKTETQDYEHIGRSFCETLLDFSDENPTKVIKLKKRIRKMRRIERRVRRAAKQAKLAALMADTIESTSTTISSKNDAINVDGKVNKNKKSSVEMGRNIPLNLMDNL